MRDQIRGLVEAGLGILSPSGAREAARSLLGGEGRERVQKAAEDLLEWSARTRERVAGMIQREVRKQLKAAGIATRDDLDALRKRVRDLEKGGPKPSPAKRSSGAAKRSSSKSSAKSTARRRSGGG